MPLMVRWFTALINNSRFYILMLAILASVMIFAGLRQNVTSDQVFFIRTQQVYGFVSIALIYIAVILTPLSKLIGKKKWMGYLLFARRAIGVSAAYYAFLHIYIAFMKQTGGFEGLALLPDRFRIAYIVGIIAFTILCFMAVTSFDKAIDVMTFTWWKRLHRFIYIAGFLIIIHVWMIGTHIVQTPYMIAATILLALLFALESMRLAKSIRQKYSLDTAEVFITGLAIFMVFITGVLALPQLIENYHGSHQNEHNESKTHD